jgi:hypothetical protein
MMKESYENIKKTAERVYPPAGAKRIASQLYQSDCELADIFPEVSPDEKLLNAIKADIAGSLNVRRQRAWRWRALAAACVALVCMAAIKIYLSDDAVTPVSPAVYTAAAPEADIIEMRWDDSDELVALSTQLESIEMALYASDDKISSADEYIAEIETLISDMKDIFWKG